MEGADITNTINMGGGMGREGGGGGGGRAERMEHEVVNKYNSH